MTLMIHEDSVQAFIIGDDVIARLGLRTLLIVTGQVTIVGEVGLGSDSLVQATGYRPDVVLLHVVTLGPDALNGLRILAGHAPVLMLVNDDSPEVVEQALRGGATGYLVNGQYSPDELIAAVLATAQGQPRLSPAAVRALVDRLRNSEEYAAQLPSSRLSRREAEIVEQLVRGHTNAEIARALGISEKTVKNHVNHVYAKLHTRNRAETVAHWLRAEAYGSGASKPLPDSR